MGTGPERVPLVNPLGVPLVDRPLDGGCYGVTAQAEQFSPVHGDISYVTWSSPMGDDCPAMAASGST
jgi:hypothetical protein